MVTSTSQKDWTESALPCVSGAVGDLPQVISDYNLTQLSLQPSIGENILDLELVSIGLSNSTAYQLPPLGRSHHKVQALVSTLIFRHQPSLAQIAQFTTKLKAIVTATFAWANRLARYYALRS